MINTDRYDVFKSTLKSILKINNRYKVNGIEISKGTISFSKKDK
tara:strand:- start:279 stop:410 length:132 start_codon:yes stop_codon:yes gene_type:complete